jgi:hypothetical protein
MSVFGIRLKSYIGLGINWSLDYHLTMAGTLAEKGEAPLDDVETGLWKHQKSATLKIKDLHEAS